MLTPTKTTNLDILTDIAHRHLTILPERWRNRLLFTDRGAMRLLHIAGWITGLANAGKVDEASKLADDLFRSLDMLVGTEDTEFTIENGGVTETLNTPARKCILGDDGCFNSFTLLWFVPINPIVYWEVVDKYRKQDETYPQDKAREELKIRDRVDIHSSYSEQLTQRRYLNGCEHSIYYRPMYNGGLIYHGPGCGQTFSVSLDNDSSHYWGIHT